MCLEGVVAVIIGIMARELYLLGDKECLKQPTIAVVGTRRVSEYGEQVTEMFVRELVKAGWCIVSGLARGVDRIAHEVAVRNGGKTVAVLAHGLDLTYPPEHEGLKKRIVENGGLLVSEYEEGVGPTRDKFRARNRVLVKLSQAVVVIEAPRRSGTKITVGHAAEQGKTVYVVPGPVTNRNYDGSVEIIRDGGVPVSTPAELLSMLESGI